MTHPDAVLRFLSQQKATRLCSDYSTAYGQFIRELFEFVLATPSVNAGVKLEGSRNPMEITLRYVDTRPPETLGVIPRHKDLDQESEFFWRIYVRPGAEGARVTTAGVFHAAEHPLNRWHFTENSFLSYVEALSHVMFEVRTFKLPPRHESMINGKLHSMHWSRHMGGPVWRPA